MVIIRRRVRQHDKDFFGICQVPHEDAGAAQGKTVPVPARGTIAKNTRAFFLFFIALVERHDCIASEGTEGINLVRNAAGAQGLCNDVGLGCNDPLVFAARR